MARDTHSGTLAFPRPCEPVLNDSKQGFVQEAGTNANYSIHSFI